jgi:hypothetical protein
VSQSPDGGNPSSVRDLVNYIVGYVIRFTTKNINIKKEKKGKKRSFMTSIYPSL